MGEEIFYKAEGEEIFYKAEGEEIFYKAEVAWRRRRAWRGGQCWD